MTHELLGQISTKVWLLHLGPIAENNTAENNPYSLKVKPDKLSKKSMLIYPVNNLSTKLRLNVKLVMRSLRRQES